MQKTLFLISLTFLFSILKQAYSDPHLFNGYESDSSQTSLDYINRDMEESSDEDKNNLKEKKRKEKEALTEKNKHEKERKRQLAVQKNTETAAQKMLYEERLQEQRNKAPKQTDNGHFLTSPN